MFLEKLRTAGVTTEVDHTKRSTLLNAYVNMLNVMQIDYVYLLHIIDFY